MTTSAIGGAIDVGSIEVRLRGAAHGAGEMQHGVGIAHQRAQRLRRGEVSGHDFHAGCEQVTRRGRVARERAHEVLRRFQQGGDAATDEPGRPGDRDAHLRAVPVRAAGSGRGLFQ